jgi:hypothetical protein
MPGQSPGIAIPTSNNSRAGSALIPLLLVGRGIGAGFRLGVGLAHGQDLPNQRRGERERGEKREFTERIIDNSPRGDDVLRIEARMLPRARLAIH